LMRRVAIVSVAALMAAPVRGLDAPIAVQETLPAGVPGLARQAELVGRKKAEKGGRTLWAGAIAVGLEALGEGRFLQRQFAADRRRRGHAERMAAGQQHRARRRADAPAHEVTQLAPLLEEAVQVRCGHIAAMDAQVAPADVIGHDISSVREISERNGASHRLRRGGNTGG
jgi:hypothetical protein